MLSMFGMLITFLCRIVGLHSLWPPLYFIIRFTRIPSIGQPCGARQRVRRVRVNSVDAHHETTIQITTVRRSHSTRLTHSEEHTCITQSTDLHYVPHRPTTPPPRIPKRGNQAMAHIRRHIIDRLCLCISHSQQLLYKYSSA